MNVTLAIFTCLSVILKCTDLCTCKNGTLGALCVLLPEAIALCWL